MSTGDSSADSFHEEQASGRNGERYKIIREILSAGPCTQNEVVAEFRRRVGKPELGSSGITTRFAELRKQGKAYPCPERRACLITGRSVHPWALGAEPGWVPGRAKLSETKRLKAEVTALRKALLPMLNAANNPVYSKRAGNTVVTITLQECIDAYGVATAANY